MNKFVLLPAMEFRGRGDEIRIAPLSFREFMSVYQGTREKGLEEYMLYREASVITFSQRYVCPVKRNVNKKSVV